MSIVTTRDQQPLYVRVIGRGQPVLMLHGLGMDSTQWLPFILPYIRQFKFYLPDFRGAGKSSAIRFKQQDVFEQHAHDIEDVIQYFDLNHFYLVGYSLGASTALHLQASPLYARVSRYLHIDQSPCVGNRDDWAYGLCGEHQVEILADFKKLLAVIAPFDGQLHLKQLPDTARYATVDLFADIFEKMLNRPSIKRVFKVAARYPLMLPYVLGLSRLEDIRLYLQAYVNGEHDYRRHLGQWQIPTTLFVGKNSTLYHAKGQCLIAEKMQPSKVIMFEKSGHGLALDEPLKFVRELGRFLKQQD